MDRVCVRSQPLSGPPFLGAPTMSENPTIHEVPKAEYEQYLASKVTNIHTSLVKCMREEAQEQYNNCLKAENERHAKYLEKIKNDLDKKLENADKWPRGPRSCAPVCAQLQNGYNPAMIVSDLAIRAVTEHMAKLSPEQVAKDRAICIAFCGEKLKFEPPIEMLYSTPLATFVSETLRMQLWKSESTDKFRNITHACDQNMNSTKEWCTMCTYSSRPEHPIPTTIPVRWLLCVNFEECLVVLKFA